MQLLEEISSDNSKNTEPSAIAHYRMCDIGRCILHFKQIEITQTRKQKFTENLIYSFKNPFI